VSVRRVRPAAVAGTFYPADPTVLGAEVDRLLAEVPATAEAAPKALIVPHAGYVYSGPIAATGYATVRDSPVPFTRVVLLGPAHRVAVLGLATSSADAWSTPLGEVTIDAEARDAACQLPGVSVDDDAHVGEHSLEVHLPFLQRVLGGEFTLAPFVVGRAEPEVVAAVLDRLWGGPETLIVVSSDLSHYLDHASATVRDRHTASMIVEERVAALAPDDACGASPVRGLLVAGSRHGVHPCLLDLRNSGDTAGSSDRVVGYGAFALRAA
jgi:AmmeMemoRadiSam system protein B